MTNIPGRDNILLLTEIYFIKNGLWQNLGIPVFTILRFNDILVILKIHNVLIATVYFAIGNSRVIFCSTLGAYILMNCQCRYFKEIHAPLKWY